MIDTTTKNKSFIFAWRFLQDKNIYNNDFMLQLNDETLQGFELSDIDQIEDAKERNELIQKVLTECKNNIWFFFREIVRIGNGVTNSIGFHENDSRFILSPLSAKLIYLYDKNQNFIVTQSALDKNHYGLTTLIHLLSFFNFNFRSSQTIPVIMDNTISDDYSIIKGIYKSNYRLFSVMDYNNLDINKKNIKIRNDESYSLCFNDTDEHCMFGINNVNNPIFLYRMIKSCYENEKNHLFMKVVNRYNIPTTFKRLINPAISKKINIDDGSIIDEYMNDLISISEDMMIIKDSDYKSIFDNHGLKHIVKKIFLIVNENKSNNDIFDK